MRRIFGKHSKVGISDKDMGRDWAKAADKSRHRPHQGEREAARRRRQAEKAAAKSEAGR